MDKKRTTPSIEELTEWARAELAALSELKGAYPEFWEEERKARERVAEVAGKAFALLLECGVPPVGKETSTTSGRFSGTDLERMASAHAERMKALAGIFPQGEKITNEMRRAIAQLYGNAFAANLGGSRQPTLPSDRKPSAREREVLTILQESVGEYVPTEQIAQKLSEAGVAVTEMGVRSAIDRLKRQGFRIENRRLVGYKLVREEDA